MSKRIWIVQEEPCPMLNSSVMFGLTAAVVLDGVMHVSGPPLATTTPVPVDLIINKVIFLPW